jgi:leucine-rich repeat protein SHOC2
MQLFILYACLFFIGLVGYAQTDDGKTYWYTGGHTVFDPKGSDSISTSPWHPLDTLVKWSPNARVVRIIMENYDSVPEVLSKLHSLETLEMPGNNFKYLPYWVSERKTLKKLDLSCNYNIDIDSLVNILQKLHVQELLIYSCGIHKLPTKISTLDSLKLLNLENNLCSDSTVYRIRSKSISHLILSRNKFKSLDIGRIINNFTNLEKLDLDNCGIKNLVIGKINKTKLWELYLDDNDLEDLPIDIGKLVQLKYLTITNNRIKMLPISIKNLKNLELIVNFGCLLDKSEFDKMKKILPKCRILPQDF